MPTPVPAIISAQDEARAKEHAPGETQAQGFECDSCGQWFDGEPGGAGLFLWTRGEEVRYEEPPLCDSCASEIAVGALVKWETEEEEEG